MEDRMLVHRRGFLRGMAATAAGSLCRPAIAQGGARPLRFVPHAPLTVLDPVWATAFVSRNHGYMVYDTLYGLGGDLQPRPQMAEGHLVEDDGLAWTITLRPGPRFHDGEPVRAADCAASLRRWGGRDTLGQTLFALTDELLVLDDRRLRFRLRRPFPLLPRALAKATPSVPFIMPERIAATDLTQQVREVIGSGPYRFVESEWQPGARAVYARFDGYEPRQEAADMLAGGKRALVGRVEWTPMPDPATAAAALQTGEVDWWEQAAADLVPALRRRRGIAIDRLDPFGNLAILRVNHLHPPFDDAVVRRALLPAIVQSDFVQAVVGQDRALWRDEVGFFTPDTPSASVASMNALSSTRDAGAARRGLEAAGRLGARTVLLAAVLSGFVPSSPFG
jgi:peptide/nickel transport system substrate-binding protein